MERKRGKGIRLKSHLSGDRKCSTSWKRAGVSLSFQDRPFLDKRCFLLSSCIEQWREWHISKKKKNENRTEKSVRSERRGPVVIPSLLRGANAQTSKIAGYYLAEIKKTEQTFTGVKRSIEKYRVFNFLPLFFRSLVPIKRKHRSVSANVKTPRWSLLKGKPEN